MSSPVRVALVDDHDFFRAGFRELLSEYDDIEIVGEADNGLASIELYERRRPDVMVMDLAMPRMSGVEATMRLTSTWLDVRVLVVTVAADDTTVIEAIRAGARGYVLKDAPVEEIVRAVHAVAAGQLLVSPRVARALVGAVGPAADRSRKASVIESALSDREREVLRLLATGRKNSEIAAVLHLSPATVKNHVTEILNKLQVENRVEAAVFAVRSGMA